MAEALGNRRRRPAGDDGRPDGLRDLALTWSGRALDVGHIEAELGKLRYLAAGQPPGGEGFAPRASLLNMVVYAEHEERALQASRVVEDLAGHHPSRALIVAARPSQEDGHIEAELAAHSHLSPEVEQQVCCEEVLLRVSGRSARHLHSVIVPLLVPDLPVYLWWTEPLPEETHLLHELMAAADHLIVDTQVLGHHVEGLLRLSRLAGSEPNTGVGDLSWDRTGPWREMLRQQRGINEMRHHLGSVESVEVRYADGRGADHAGQALLFLSWLALELGWDTKAVSGHRPHHLSIRHEDRTIGLHLRPVQYPAVQQGWLVAVKIACRSPTARALLLVSRTGDPYHITIRTEHRGEAGEEHVRVEPPGQSDLLAMELDVPRRDSEFSRALRNAVPLLQAVRAQPGPGQS
jgi:glucose-6-phosphate dehydrogenase assembly protein OpcA